MKDIAIFSGSAHPALAEEICTELELSLSPSVTHRFANDCLEVQLQESCRERDVFLVQPLTAPVQDHLVELLLAINAAKGASAGRVTAVIPHFAYARSDKKDAPRISLGGKLVADLLVTAGADRVLTMALHSPQVHGFFNVPVDHLHALSEMAEHFRASDLTDTVIVSPDLGNAKVATAFARSLDVSVAAGAKQRFANDQVAITSIIGDVEGRNVIVLDDEIAKGSTIIEVCDRLAEHKVQSIRVACTHGLFSAGALDRLSDRPDIREIVCTNTVPLPSDATANDKLTVLSVAPAFAEAIRRIHNGESVSALFGVF